MSFFRNGSCHCRALVGKAPSGKTPPHIMRAAGAQSAIVVEEDGASDQDTVWFDWPDLTRFFGCFLVFLRKQACHGQAGGRES
jgi:hypothetical protein